MGRTNKKGGSNRRGRGRKRTRRMNGGANTRDYSREIPSDLFVDDGRLQRIPSDFMDERSMVPDQTQHLTLQFLNTRISNEINDLRQYIKKLEDDIKELKLNHLPTNTVSPLAIVPREEPIIGNDYFEGLINHPRRAWA